MRISPWARLLVPTAIAVLIPSAAFSQTTPSSATFVNNLMPQPTSLIDTHSSLVLTAQFSAGVIGFDNSRLDAAIREAIRQLKQKTGLPLAQQIVPAGSGAQLTIAVKGAGEEIQSVDKDESYALSVAPIGVRIEAPTVVGAMRGLQTLVQLVQSSGGEYVLPAVTIHDSPRFPLARPHDRRQPPLRARRRLKRTLDGMAAVKLNVFHWHLTDDQGFRVESKIFPKLTDIASAGLFYTQDQDARRRRLRPRPRHPRHARIRHARPHHGLAPRLSRTRQRRGLRSISPPTSASPIPRWTPPARDLQVHRPFLGEMAASSPTPTCTSAATKPIGPSGSRIRES